LGSLQEIFCQQKSKTKKHVGFPKFKREIVAKQSYKTNQGISSTAQLSKASKLTGGVVHKSQEIAGTLVNVTVTTSSGKTLPVGDAGGRIHTVYGLDLG